jgi:hypothetical protein
VTIRTRVKALIRNPNVVRYGNRMGRGLVPKTRYSSISRSHFLIPVLSSYQPLTNATCFDGHDLDSVPKFWSSKA